MVDPELLTIVFDSLLRRLLLPAPAFADNFKFEIDLEHHSLIEVKDDLATVDDWSNTYFMPLSIEKLLVLHCGAHNSNHIYML